MTSGYAAVDQGVASGVLPYEPGVDLSSAGFLDESMNLGILEGDLSSLFMDDVFFNVNMDNWANPLEYLG